MWGTIKKGKGEILSKLCKQMISDAFFISPKGIIPVERRHIDEIIKFPRRFGYTKSFVEKVYAFFHEEIGTESAAREFLIGELLQKGWGRVRINQNHVVNIQIGITNQKTYQNILTFFEYLKKAVGVRKFKNYGVRIYVSGDNPFLEGFTTKETMAWLKTKGIK